MVFKNEKDRLVAYKNTFASGQDIQVLVDILGTLGFWDTIQSSGLSEVEQNALNLHAKKILERCGFWKPENYQTILANMLGQIAPKKKRLFERSRK